MDIELHNTRAQVAWKILIRHAKKTDPRISYLQLEDLMGVHHRQHANFLELIQIYCHEFELPHLTALVVSDKSGVPGPGCDVDRDQIPAEYVKIKNFKWPATPESFVTPGYLRRHKSTRELLESYSQPRTNVNYWWINHGITYKYEIKGDFLWSPKNSKDGSRNHYYDNMAALRPGDQVFSYSKGSLRSFGVVKSFPTTSPRPDFGSASKNWAESGWLVDVSFQDLPHIFQPKNDFNEIKSLMDSKYLPLDRNGDGQGSLTKISKELASYIRVKGEVDEVKIAFVTSDSDEEQDDLIEKEIQQRTNIGPLEKLQLVKSRRGQGVFKANVKLYENHCRVTGLTESGPLIASHIKPWSKSSDSEKIDGFNGFLLSPHIDYLFDAGLISFGDNGELLISKTLDPNILRTWNLPTDLDVGTFHPEQIKYLSYHREKVFLK